MATKPLPFLTNNKRPFPMRRRRADLRGGSTGTWRCASSAPSYAGLQFVRRYLDLLRLGPMLRRELAAALPRTDFGGPAMVLVVLALVISGGRRLRHLLYLDGDPLVLRLCGLTPLPTPRTLGRWLRAFRARHLPALQWVNALVVARTLRHVGGRRLTVDVDASVVSTGQQVEW